MKVASLMLEPLRTQRRRQGIVVITPMAAFLPKIPQGFGVKECVVGMAIGQIPLAVPTEDQAHLFQQPEIGICKILGLNTTNRQLHWHR